MSWFVSILDARKSFWGCKDCQSIEWVWDKQKSDFKGAQ